MIAVVVRHARRVSGITDLSIKFNRRINWIRNSENLCSVQIQRRSYGRISSNLNAISGNVNQYMKNFQVGQRILQDVKSLDELPANARQYVERVSQLTGIPLSIFSVGPDRTQTNVD